MTPTFGWYAVHTRHDKGEITIYTVATGAEAAKHLVMAAERCPERSILSIERRPPADHLQPEVAELVRALGYKIVEDEDTDYYRFSALYWVEESGLFDTKTEAAEYLIKEKA